MGLMQSMRCRVAQHYTLLTPNGERTRELLEIDTRLKSR
jgi:hypothetical protein